MAEPERTDDGRYIVVDGRKWRASDPSIPDALRQQLVNELMAARREVRTEPEAARPRVRDAKLALGERGEPWWDDPSEEGQRLRAAAAIRTLARSRAPKTLCPSEVARIIGGEHWRASMPLVRAVADELADDGAIVVTQKGVQVSAAAAKGPIRLALPAVHGAG